MSAATAGFIIGMFVGGLTVFVMMSVIITASRADEKEKRLFEEYLKEKRRVLICRYREKHGELPKCNGNCWGCDYADVERKEENSESLHGDNQG